MKHKHYILTLSCDDTTGIVAAVSGLLAKLGGFIVESAQFGDPSTGKFFMRTMFSVTEGGPSHTELKAQFSEVAETYQMAWDIHDMATRPNILVMVSKAGHCLNAILHRYKTGRLPVEIPAVVSNHPELEEMVRWYNIPFICLPVDKEGREAQEAEIFRLIQEHQVELVVLARYMQILSDDLCMKLEGRAINIHHSFLPSFKGARPYHQAYHRGVKIIGATAHYVTTDLDEGPIIEQEVVRVNHAHAPEALVSLGQDIESTVLMRALKYHVERRILQNGNKTVIFT
ncbi:MAG: formyltetrahydrofolate deformylase [Hyphomicrobiales bacterium]|nr:formyltetrahydrofolate deformylase [Rickettsiales bacterium]MCP5361137.1 formyltetrahydrofolate deformylase [Hyphomicrobiales bacterium]